MYFRLSLKTRRKRQRNIKIRCGNYDLIQLNSILNLMLKNLRSVKSVKCKSPVKILKLLDVIIPNDYFGTTRHRKLFYHVVNKILTQSCYECVYSSALIKGYNCTSVPWLSGIKGEKLCQSLMKKSYILVLEQVVKPLIAFYYKPVTTYNGHEIQFIRKEKWSSFETRSINKLKKFNYLVQNETCTVSTARGFLKIIPKGKCDDQNFRAIVSVFPDNKKAAYKTITSKIYQAAKEMNVYFSASVYEEWNLFLQRIGDAKLYGVKMDIRDAYGNVDLSVLCNLVLGLKSKFLSESNKKFVVNHVTNQFVKFGKTVYRWKHGLLQGDRLSSCLCELYMTYLDKTFLSKLDSDCFMHRTVDDYFFCSTEAYKVDKFISVIKDVHQVNRDKTKTNILYNSSDEEIPYCGKLFNLATKEVKTFYKFGDKYEIRHRFKLWNVQKQIPGAKIFLERAMQFSYSSNCFTKLELNTVFNSQRTVLENFFKGMIYAAYKFDAAVMALRSSTEDFNFVAQTLDNIVRKYASKVYEKIQKYKGVYHSQDLTFQVLRILGYKAFTLVFKRRNEIYKELIDQIRHVSKLKLNFFGSQFDSTYFNKLPQIFKDVKINRKASI